jgi:hypothetical protein
MDSSSPEAGDVDRAHAALRPTLNYGGRPVRAWPWHLARGFAGVSVFGTSVIAVAFLLGHRYEYPPPWMLACISLQALFLPSLMVTPLIDARLPAARKAGLVYSASAFATAALVWTLLGTVG